MALCKKCNVDVDDGNFCPSCGAQINANSAENPYVVGSQTTGSASIDPRKDSSIPGFREAFGRFWKRNAGGRAGRTEYWYVMLWQFLITLPIIVLYVAATATEADALIMLLGVASIVYAVYVIVCIFRGICLYIRRLHDVGLSGWYWLVNFVPYVGGIFALVITLLPSQKTDNRFGRRPSPKR